MTDRGVKRQADRHWGVAGNVKKRHLDGKQQGSGETIPNGMSNMSRNARKPVFGVSDQYRHKLAFTTTDDG